MTNRDLPALPEWMHSYKIPCDAFDGDDDVRLSDRMRAYGELCRAAPASLDMERELNQADTLCRRLTRELDSARSELRDVWAAMPKHAVFIDPPDGGEVSLAEQVRRLGESHKKLCRAAPAGGDMPDVLHPQYRHGFEAGMKFEGEHGLMTTNKIDSAPAGSGEVTDEMVEAACDALDDACVAFHRDGHPSASVHWNGFMRSDRNAVMRAALSAALLRKLQQGADYVMVPRIPTHAMRAAGERERMSHPGNINPLTTWDAMIAASQGQETE